MVVRDDDTSAQESRPPELEDLLGLARELNSRGAKYLIIGGIAVIQQGFTRGTEDIDLLVEKTEGNLKRVIDAVAQLPDHAAQELAPKDFDEFEVIRVADEIVIDLMVRASNLTYADSKSGITIVNIRGVEIPFAGAELLLKMKQGVREKDVLDRRYLEELLRRS